MPTRLCSRTHLEEDVNAEPPAPGIRRLCLASDLHQYSRLDGDGQALAQKALSNVLAAAKRATGLSPVCWHTQASGDGEMAVLPPGINEREMIQRYVVGLRQALAEENRFRTADTRLRLRVAVHEGVIRLAEQGFAGRAAVLVNRLLDSAPVREALVADTETDLALIVSQPIYDDHVGDDHHDFAASSFRQVHISAPAKDFRTYAWLWVSQDVDSSEGIPEVKTEPATVEGAGSTGIGGHDNRHLGQGTQNNVQRDQVNVNGNQYNSGRDQTIVHGDQIQDDRWARRSRRGDER
jgi:hypothetical protein